MGHITPWFKTLLFKWPWQVPNRLFLVWLTAWVLTIGIIGGSIIFFADGEYNPFGVGLQGKVYTFLSTAFLAWLQKTLIGSIGDAARYLTPDPNNISERQNIRKNGIELLKKLHEPDEDGKPKYDRIIIVGHSLGSVIAYDMITHLWPQFNTIYGEDKYVDKNYFEELKTSSDNLSKAIKNSWPTEEINKLKDAFQEKQIALGNAMREAGSPWLVTDFITMGCPLAHGAFLLSRNKEDFDERKHDRELLTCPPVLDDNEKYYYYNLKERRYYLHHAAAFAPTTWTNIYFPGDFIGGPVAESMGHGVRDIKVKYNGFLNKIICHFSPVTHIAYWRDKADLNKMEIYKTRGAIKALFEAIDLNRETKSAE